MDKKRSTSNLFPPEQDKKIRRKVKVDCVDTPSSSHTQIFRRKELKEEYERITNHEYLRVPKSTSSSANTYRGLHESATNAYTDNAQFKKKPINKLHPIPTDHMCGDGSRSFGLDLATLEFLVKDPIAGQNTERLDAHVRDFAKTARFGYKIEDLNSLTTIIDYLVDNLEKRPTLREGLLLLLSNMDKPILLRVASDIITQFDSLTNYIGFLGYLLLRVEQEDLFDLISRGVLWQLSAVDGGGAGVGRRHTLAAASLLPVSVARTLALASPRRFPAFQRTALLLACHSDDFCLDMIKENILENIFYRFNPYFPMKDLPDYEENPLDPQDFNVKLGESSVHMSTTLSLLLVLVKTLKSFLHENPESARTLPCPDYYAQRCFLWAYRYECRARGRAHERNTLNVIARALLSCFGERLRAFGTLLMPDIMSLSVLTEIPPKQLWMQSVNFNTSQLDVQFKKTLIYLSVDFLKIFPYNNFMVESQYWLVGLMFLLDPDLCPLRANWSHSLFSEIRKTAMQALICTLPLMPTRLVLECEIIRRLLWYIEWYSESPYELPVLYWCLRVLRCAVRGCSLHDLFDTHGVTIIMRLCYTLLDQRCPPVEKSQVVLALAVDLLAQAAIAERSLTCRVYPELPWPDAIEPLAARMLNTAMHSLEKHLIVSDRWLISLLNFIWEAIIWRPEYREKFVLENGVYNLLDIITMVKPPVQCLAMALVCDVARTGAAVAQLTTWRAPLAASNAYPAVVKRGATIASLLASLFRDDCEASGVQLDCRGVIQDLDGPLMSTERREEFDVSRSSVDLREGAMCSAAEDTAGSRMSKAFAILHILSEDLQHKVSLADEAYNLYKNIKVAPEDETILVLCSHYLTLKLNETWIEAKNQNVELLSHDREILYEFIEINGGWAKEVKRQQEDLLIKYNQKDVGEEKCFYAFLAQVRLNLALEGLRQMRCAGRTAVFRRPPTTPVAEFHRTLIPTNVHTLGDLNLTGQRIKVRNNPVKKVMKLKTDGTY